MKPGEIPDSDPFVSEEASLNFPEWIEQNSPQLDRDGRTRIESQDPSDADITLEVHEPVREPSAVLVREAQSPAFQLDTRDDPFFDNAQRRRRFNFTEWVKEDRRTHEYVYKQRFENYHGALSDSEDEDFGDLQDDKESDLEEIEEDSSSDSENVFSEESFARLSRRREAIESDTSDSEPNEEDEDISLFERMLKRPISATPSRAFADSNKDWNESQSLEFQSLESSLEASQELESHRTSYSRTRNDGEAEEGPGNVDFMTDIRGNRRHHPRLARDVIELADSADPKTLTRPLKIAARTAKFNRNATHSAQLSDGSESPSEREEAEISTGAIEVPGPLGKLFVNQSAEAMRSLRRMQSNFNKRVNLPSKIGKLSTTERQSTKDQPTNVRPLDVSNRLWGLPEEPRDIARYKRLAPQNNVKKRKKESRKLLAPTSIVELTQKTSHTPSRHRVNVARSTSHVERPKSITKSSGISNRVCPRPAVPDLTSIRDVASARVFGFSTETFLGSNVIELLQGPCFSNAQPICLDKKILHTSVKDSNRMTIRNDVAVILQLCERSPLQLAAYDEIYDYFLLGVAYLIDESQILEEGYLGFVRDTWLRLARRLLKLSICQSWVFRAVRLHSLLITEVVIVAVIFVHARLRLTNRGLSKNSKVNQLFAWTTFYHQSAIFGQLDQARNLESRERSGVELVYFGSKFCGLELMPQIFAKSQKSKASWHTIELLAAINSSWSDWDLPRKLLALNIKCGYNVRVAMEHIQRLLSFWKWQGCPDIIADLFVHFTEQQTYVDPKGESIWMPQFLLSSQFDGTNRPSQDFSMFLELLGTTLRKMKDDVKTCLSLAGRVTPLNALSFPASKEVSLADLSSASHQFGILIILTRMLDVAHRPSISQFRESVILKNAHWAIRIKAVSTWSILVQLVAPKNLRECCIWMNEDIFAGNEFPDLLIQLALRESSEVMPLLTDGVPWKRLLELGFRSNDTRTRRLAWDMSERCGSLLSLSRLTEIFLSLENRTDLDIDRFSHLLVDGHSTCAAELFRTQKLPLKVVKEIYSWLCERDLIKTLDEKKDLHFILLESLLDLEICQDQGLLAAAGVQIDGSLISRRLALRNVVGKVKLDERDWKHVFQLVQRNLSSLSSAEASSYISLTGEARRLGFSEYPDLINQFPLTEEQMFNDGETMQHNVLTFVYQKDSSCFLFLANKLRQCCPTTGAFDPAKDLDFEFRSELLSSIYVRNDENSQFVSNLLMNYLFASFFDLARGIYSRTRKSRVSYALPTIVKCAIANMGRANKLQYGCGRLLQRLAVYLNCRIKLDVLVMEQHSTLYLSTLFCDLSTIWLHQSHSSGHRDPKFSELILLLAKRMLARLENLSVSSTDFSDDLGVNSPSTSEEFPGYPAFDDEGLLNSFDCDEAEENIGDTTIKANASLQIDELVWNCMIYQEWCHS